MATRKSESIEVAHVRTDEQDLDRIYLASQESVTFTTNVTSDSTNGDSEAASSRALSRESCDNPDLDAMFIQQRKINNDVKIVATTTKLEN